MRASDSAAFVLSVVGFVVLVAIPGLPLLADYLPHAATTVAVRQHDPVPQQAAKTEIAPAGSDAITHLQ